MVTFSSLNTKIFAVEWILEFPAVAWAATCCSVDANNPPAADGCRKPRRALGGASDIEIAPAGTPLLDGSGTASESTINLKMNSGVMTDNISVDINNVLFAETNNSNGLIATIPANTTSIIAYIEECYLQTGGWVTLPDTQGTDYEGSATFTLYVVADETDIDLGD